MSSSIKVGLKFRPTAPSEIKNVQWTVNGNNVSSKNSKYNFSFANVFDESSTNEDVYQKLGSPIVLKCLEGFNGAILTYGQTSSGKTYTMMGSEGAKGIVELTIDDVFGEIEKCSDKSYSLSVAFIEVYNEKIYDLLVERKPELKLFEKKGETTINQRQVEIKSKKDILKLLREGNRNKHIASTVSNEQSSRSHTIFTVSIESTNSEAESKSSKLFLVDLAGSEKPDANKSSFNEGLHINKSLLALGKIIRQLSEKNINVKNLRYRESLLTRLLSSSLGGNSFTSIICTASLASLDETFYTICFAQNAEKAKCKPTLNGINDATKEVSILKVQVQKLQSELDLERSRSQLQDTSIACNETYVIRPAVQSAEEFERGKKRVRSELEDTPTQQTPKVFIQSLTRDQEIIQELQVELQKARDENEQLRDDLMACNQNLRGILEHNEELSDKLRHKEHKKSKILQKCKLLREKLMSKKVVKIKENSTLIENYDDFIDGLNRKQTNEMLANKDLEIANLNSQLNLLKTTTAQDLHHHRIAEEKLKDQLAETLSAYKVMQTQLYETSKQLELIRHECEEVQRVNKSLKESFKTSLKNTREQYHVLLRQKQNQSSDYRQQLNDLKTEHLRDVCKLQEHYAKQCSAFRSANEEQQSIIDQLETKLSELNDAKRSADERKHETEKIKFIKQHFETKLCEKVNYFEKLLIEREKELSTLRSRLHNGENNCTAFAKLVISN